jgi:HNH endonuclease
MAGNVEMRSLEALGFPYHLVSSDGRVWSTIAAKNQFVTRVGPPKPLQPCPGSHGYLTVLLRCQDGVQRSFLVHHLVGRTFLGNPPEWHEEYRHLDNDKVNCAVSNLSFGTRKQNAEDRIKAGTWMNGPKANTKVTATILAQVQDQLALGRSGRSIASDLGLSEASISTIKNNKGRFSRPLAA